jgi:ubiquinone biosynthesis accessory factor UbiK
MPAGICAAIKGLRFPRHRDCIALARIARPDALSECDGIVEGYVVEFMNSTGLDDLARRLADSVPPALKSLAKDLESNFKAVLQAQLARLDLVSRNEFDVQAALLARTQAALAAMEERLKEIESRLAPP